MIIQKYHIQYEASAGQGKTSSIEFSKSEKTLQEVEAVRDQNFPGGDISECQEEVAEET